MTDQTITPAALRYLANDFACNADHPTHRERLKGVVRTALERAADRLELVAGLLMEWEEVASYDASMWMPEEDDVRKRTRAALGIGQ
jgi:hypothetical protein